MSVTIVCPFLCQRTAPNFTVLTDSTIEFTSLMLFDHRLVTRLATPPSLHDAECKMRNPCALDHVGALQLDRFRGSVE
jgi:hypothetical protein